MKVIELLEGSITGVRKMRHQGDRAFGIRFEVTKKQRQDIIDMIATSLKVEPSHVIYTAPEHASTFPCEIRVVFDRKDSRYSKDELDGSMAESMVKAAARKAVKKVLGVEALAIRDSDHYGNGLRYIDIDVGWRNK